MAYHQQQQPQYSPNMYPVQQPASAQPYPQSPYGGPVHQQQHQHQPPQQHMYGVPGGSQPSLPRYASQASSLGSPLNPYSQQQQQMPFNQQPPRPSSSGNSSPGGPYSPNGSNGNKYSTYGYGNGGPGAQGGAHPLSHALYSESPSSPTLAGDAEDEKKGLASFPPVSSSSSSGSSGNHNTKGIRGRAGAAASSAKAVGNSAYRRWSGSHATATATDARHTKIERLGWLDGLRFLAAWAVVNATFFGAVIPDQNMYSAIQRSSPLYIFRSFGLALSFLLIILGRACTASLWDVSPSSPAAKPGTASGPTIAFPRLTRAMLTRTARFVLPVLVIAAALWGLGASNATKDCNTAGMQQPYWNLIRSFSGYMTIVFNCFSAFSYQTQAAQYFAGNLWTNAWFFQASFCVYICHMMLGNLSSARHWTYILLIFFMWTTYQYFALAMIGAVYSDLAAHGVFARMKKWPFVRTLGIHIILVGVACALQFINVVRNGLNNAMATINVGNIAELQFADLIFASCFMFVFESSSILQVILGNIVMRMLGKLAAGMYLLAPIVTYTIVPTLAVSLAKNGSSGMAVTAVTWVVCFAICVVAALPFHFLVELPSKMAGEYIGDMLTKWGALPDDGTAQVKAPQKSAPKKLSGPGAK